jgi:hypothetical protein
MGDKIIGALRGEIYPLYIKKAPRHKARKRYGV